MDCIQIINISKTPNENKDITHIVVEAQSKSVSFGIDVSNDLIEDRDFDLLHYLKSMAYDVLLGLLNDNEPDLFDREKIK